MTPSILFCLGAECYYVKVCNLQRKQLACQLALCKGSDANAILEMVIILVGMKQVVDASPDGSACGISST
jgi:hypothetical protein